MIFFDYLSINPLEQIDMKYVICINSTSIRNFAKFMSVSVVPMGITYYFVFGPSYKVRIEKSSNPKLKYTLLICNYSSDR